MNIYQCEEKAKEIGFNKAKFLAFFPARIAQCHWVDAYFGFFTIDDIDGMVRAKDIDAEFPDLVVSDPYVAVEDD